MANHSTFTTTQGLTIFFLNERILFVKKLYRFRHLALLLMIMMTVILVGCSFESSFENVQANRQTVQYHVVYGAVDEIIDVKYSIYGSYNGGEYARFDTTDGRKFRVTAGTLYCLDKDNTIIAVYSGDFYITKVTE